MHSHATFANRLAVCTGVAVLLLTVWLRNTTSEPDQSAGGARQLQAASGQVDVGFEVFRYSAIVILVILSGVFSGLTLGLLGLDTNQLAIVAEAGSPSKRADALRIQPLRKRGNQLLCTLLLGNVAVNSALSILMADVTGAGAGVAISTVVITIFGEILPQATCSRFPLYIGARSVPLVMMFMVLLFPASYPLSLALDWLLGKEVGDFYEHDEFEMLIKKHAENRFIESDPARIMQGALGLSNKRVKDVMTPREEVFSLLSTQRLDYETMAEIFRQGYSRIPVFDADDENKVVGMLYSKDLMLLVPAKKTPVATVLAFFNRQQVTYVNAEDRIDDAFRRILASKRHIAIVQTVDDTDDTRDPVLTTGGLITLEDIIEMIIQADVTDEYDSAAASGADTSHMATDTLRLLTDVSKGFNDLDDSMVRAVTAHLTTNVSAFRKPHPRTGLTLSLEAVSELVQGSRVVELVMPPGVKPEVAWLYRRGNLEDVCSVILEGEVEVLAGEDEIRVTRSTYDVLAERAVLSSTYRADFSARPRSRVVRLLRLTRNDVEEAFRVRRSADGVVSGDSGARALSHAEVVAAAAEGRETTESLLTPTAAAAAAAADASAASPSSSSSSSSSSAARGGEKGGDAEAEGEEEEDGAVVAPGARAGSANDLFASTGAEEGKHALSGSPDTRGRSTSLPRSPRAAGLIPRTADGVPPAVKAVERRTGMKEAGLFERYTMPKKKQRNRPDGAAAAPAAASAPTSTDGSKPPSRRGSAHESAEAADVAVTVGKGAADQA